MKNPIKCPHCGEPFEMYIDIIEMDIFTWDEDVQMFTKHDTSPPEVGAHRCGVCLEKIPQSFIDIIDKRGLMRW